MKLAAPNELDVFQAREVKAALLSPDRPVGVIIEQERQTNGTLASVLTLFLNVQECPLRCTMCDLWKPMQIQPVSSEQLVQQIESSTNSHPKTDQLKLYNSGNFFDPGSIPTDSYPHIGRIASNYERVIIENHPQIGWSRLPSFTTHLSSGTRLEVAMGLEIASDLHLRWLNKRMTCQQFADRCHWLREQSIDVRAFVLLKPPPIQDDVEAIELALKTLRFAWECGVQTVSLIPTRATTALMRQLQQTELFVPPRLSSLEQVVQTAQQGNKGQLLIDLWDLDRLYAAEQNLPQRIERLAQFNFTQQWPMTGN